METIQEVKQGPINQQIVPDSKPLSEQLSSFQNYELKMPEESLESQPKKKRGRPRKSAQTEEMKDLSTPSSTLELPGNDGLQSNEVKGLVSILDSLLLSKYFGPLEPKELDMLSNALTPVLNKYMPIGMPYMPEITLAGCIAMIYIPKYTAMQEKKKELQHFDRFEQSENTQPIFTNIPNPPQEVKLPPLPEGAIPRNDWHA